MNSCSNNNNNGSISTSPTVDPGPAAPPDGGETCDACDAFPNQDAMQYAKVVLKSWIPAGFARYPGAPDADPPYGFDKDALDVAYAIVAAGSAADNGDTDLDDRKFRLWSQKRLGWVCQNGTLTNFADYANRGDTGLEFNFIDPGAGVRFNDHISRLSDNEATFTWGFKARPPAAVEAIMGLARPNAPARTSVYAWHVITGRIHCDTGGPLMDSSRILIDKLQGSKFPNHTVFVNGVVQTATAPGFFTDLWIPDAADNTMVIRGAAVKPPNGWVWEG